MAAAAGIAEENDVIINYFLCIRGSAGVERHNVRTLADASAAVRSYIERNNLGSRDFQLATIRADHDDGGKEMYARVSYNGRVWACRDNSEIV